MFQFFLFIIMTVVSSMLRPKANINAPQPSALGDFQLPTAEYGRSVPVVFGQCYVKGANVVWYGDLMVREIRKTSGGGGWFSKKQSYTAGYKYYLGAQLVFCHGMSAWEVANGSGLVELRFDDKVPAQTSTVVGTDAATQYQRVQLSSPDLFGGEDKEGGVEGRVDFHYGQATQLPDEYLANIWGTLVDPGNVWNIVGMLGTNVYDRIFDPAEIPAYRGYCYASFNRTYWGTSNYIKPVGAVVRRYPWFWAGESSGWNINGNANPAAMIVDLMTNPTYGAGVPFTQIGDSFRLAAIRLRDEGLGLSMVFDKQSPAKDFALEIMRHIDGAIYTDPATGKLEIKLARDDYDLNSIPALTPDNVITLKMNRSSWSDTKNVVKIRFTNRDRAYQTDVVEHQNQASIEIRGEKDEDTYDFRGISDTATANKIAARVLRTVSQPLARLQLEVNRDAFAFVPGSVFALSWPQYGINKMACRVTRIAYGDLTDPKITIEALEDIFGVLETQFTAPPSSEWVDPAAIELLNLAERLDEVPYHIVGSELRQVMTLAVRSNTAMAGYKVLTHTGDGNYQETYDSAAFTPAGFLGAAYGLTAAIDDVGIEVRYLAGADSLASITLAQRLEGVNMLLIDNELMTFSTVTSLGNGAYRISGIVRGVLDTVPATHASGAQVWFPSYGAGLTTEAGYANDVVVTAKLLPYTASATALATSATARTYSTNARALRPYPAGNVRVNGLAYAARIAGNATLTWSHRPKATMLAERKVVDQDYDGYATPDGTYTVKVLVGGSVKRTFTDLTGKTQSYTAAQRAADSADGTLPVVFQLTSVNAAGYSSTRSTAPIIMTGLGMTLGEYLGGEQL